MRRRMVSRIIIAALIILPVLCTAQEVIWTRPPVDPNRTLVFFPNKDIPPPYVVTGELVDGAIKIYINGIQTRPDPQPKRSPLPKGRFDLCREEFGNLQCEMQALGHSHEEVIVAMAERIGECPGVVTDLDKPCSSRA